ncbi:MAG: glycosyltransferase [Chloroflexota bacterium]
MPLHVLGITFDGGLAHPLTEKKYSGSQRRHLHYATQVEEYIIIARRYQNSVPASVRLTSNMQIYSTATLTQWRFTQEAYQLGVELARFHPFNLISAANPHEAGIVGYLLKRRFNIPLNLHIKADIIDNPHFIKERRRNILYNRLSKWLLTKADSIRVTTSREEQKFLNMPGLPKVYNIPAYVNIGSVLVKPTANWREKLLGRSHKHLVLSVGQLIEQNDPLTFLGAADHVVSVNPDTKFVWVGNGYLNQTVKNKIELLGLQDHVTILEKVPFKQIREIYQAADVYVATPLYDGTGRALNEAAVAVTPLVSTRFAGAIDLIENGVQGYRVPVQDARQIGNRINLLLETPENLRPIGREAQKKSLALYKKKAIIAQYLKMWQETAGVDSLKSKTQK